MVSHESACIHKRLQCIWVAHQHAREQFMQRLMAMTGKGQAGGRAGRGAGGQAARQAGMPISKRSGRYEWPEGGGPVASCPQRLVFVLPSPAAAAAHTKGGGSNQVNQVFWVFQEFMVPEDDESYPVCPKLISELGGALLSKWPEAANVTVTGLPMQQDNRWASNVATKANAEREFPQGSVG